jgi:general secretion pathway protein D
VLGENITFGEVTFPTISALINAVSNDTDFNILSTPQLLTTDNVEAEVKVAQNIPFLTQSAQGDQTTSRVIQSFEYKDVGVVLKVTPQINKDRFVRLNIEEEVKNVIQAQTQSSSGEVLLAPTTNVRSAKTTVIVKDGETVVIGGLVQDVRTGQEVKVPCLGSLPVLGALFRTQTDGSSKTNLLVFLTPHIVENTAEARELYLKKKAEMEEVQRQQSTILDPAFEKEAQKVQDEYAPKPQDKQEDKK